MSAVAEAVRALSSHIKANRLDYYAPYPRQKDFHIAAASHRETLFMAANQTGKSVAGAHHVAMALTGRYPEWYPHEYRYKVPIRAWAAGISGEQTRDNVQRLLFGELGKEGAGTIPKGMIKNVTKARGAAGLIDTALIRHVTGGMSYLALKSYEKGREKWQGETVDMIWYDEEPPEDIYFEGLTRTNAKQGKCIITFTPLLGASNVVMRFLGDTHKDRATVRMTIHDAGHYTPEQAAQIIDGYPEHERASRAYGEPKLGSGAIYPIPTDMITVKPFAIPANWPRICGVDFGWDHPFAAVWIAIDPSNGTAYVYDCYRVRKQTPIVHAAAIRDRGKNTPIAWPHDGLQTEKGAGEQLKEQYIKQMLNMLSEHATHEGGGYSPETGISEILQALYLGQLRIFSHLNDFLEEYNLYHRAEGKIHKERDDLLDAMRCAWMMRRFAVALEPVRPRRNESRNLSWKAV